MDRKQEIIDWLRDAYALERSLEVTLEKMSKNGEHTIPCRTAAALHLTETRQHAETVESLLRTLGADPSSFKTGMGIMTEAIQGFGTALSHNEPVKDLLTAYSMEHFEIASYEALAAAAELSGFPHVSNACKQIVLDEEKMAENIRKELPRVVGEYLNAAPVQKAA